MNIKGLIMDNEEKIKYELDKSLELRNFEINNFWKRGWFFGALLLFLFTASVNTSDSISICICFLTFLVSLSQSLINRGSKYWQERWEYKVKNREKELLLDITQTKKYNNTEHNLINSCIYDKNENILSRAKRFSVSKLTIFVWDMISISCLLYWVYKTLILLGSTIKDVQVLIIYHTIILLYLLLFFTKSKFSESTKNGLKYGSKKQRLEEARVNKKKYLSE